MHVYVTEPIPPQVTIVMTEREAKILRTVVGNFTKEGMMDHVAFAAGVEECDKWLDDLYATLSNKLFPEESKV